MGKDKKPFSVPHVMIEGQSYTVQDFPYEAVMEQGPHILRKAMAYRFNTDMLHYLLPYRGLIPHNGYMELDAKIGVYIKEHKSGRYQVRLVLPKTKAQRKEYALEKETNLLAFIMDGADQLDQFVTYNIDPDALTNAYKPPLFAEDDPLNKLMKIAIREKNASFDVYGKRLEALAVNKNGTESLNSKNNAKRKLSSNRNMSPTKFMMFANVWQLDAVFIVRDKPDAMDKMFPDDKLLAIYPSGVEFDIDQDKIINVNEFITPDMYKNDRSSTNDDDE